MKTSIPPGVFDIVKTVDSAKNTVTLILRPGRGDTPAEEKTYNVAKDARIVLEGKEGKLADLKAGDDGAQVWMKLSLDQKAVQSINVAAPRR